MKKNCNWSTTVVESVPLCIRSNREQALYELLQPITNYKSKIDEICRLSTQKINKDILEVFYKIINIESNIFDDDLDKYNFLITYLEFLRWKGTTRGITILANGLFNCDVNIYEHSHISEPFSLESKSKVWGQYLVSRIEREHSYVVIVNLFDINKDKGKQELFQNLIENNSPVGHKADVLFKIKQGE